MKKFALGVLLVLCVGGIAGLIWHLSRPVRDVTWVRVHVTTDPALPPGELWVGDHEIGSEAWIELSGRARRAHELAEFSELWTLDPRQLTKIIEPRGTLVSTAPEAPLFSEVLVAHGDYPVRGYTGTAEVNGERHSYLWLIVGEPDEPRPCGIALRGSERGRLLVARDVILPIPKKRSDSFFEQVVLRRRVTERVIVVEFGLARD